MKVTARDIARKLNVSTAAISMALNNKPGVSDQLRQKIIRTAREMGYDFSRIEARQNASNTIGFVFFHKNFVFDTPFFAELAQSLEAAIKKQGYSLAVFHIHDLDQIEEEVASLQVMDYAGIILLGTTMNAQEFEPFRKLKAPLVLLDTCFTGQNVNCVTIANLEGAQTATGYLIEKFHEQPGYLHASQEIVNFRERKEGFYEAIRSHSLSPSNSIVHTLAPSLDGAYGDMLAILRNGEPTARCYFADNDEIALGAMRAFKAMGFRVPEDVAIAGFDNISYASLVEPALTTYHVPKDFMGRTAAELLLQMIESHEKQTLRISINGRLILRDSA